MVEDKIEIPIQDARKKIADKLRKLFPGGCHRILLIEPPNVPKEDWSSDVAIDNRYPVYMPTGLATLSACLQNNGFPRGNIELLDLNFLLQVIFKYKCSSDLQGYFLIKDLLGEEFAKKVDSALGFDFDVWKEILEHSITEFKPDMVGMGCMFTIYYRQMKRMAEFIKAEVDPSIVVMAGGVHTSDAADLVAQDCHYFDMLCLFEGNASFPNMIDFINGKADESNLTQLATVIDGEYVAIRERAKKTGFAMNTIPDYHDLPLSEYSPRYGRIGTFYWLWKPGTRAGTILSNIGCRAQCTFCSVRYFNGKGVFTRDVKYVADEFEMIRDKYDITHFMFLDDDLLFDPVRTLQLFNEIVRRNLKFTLDASNGIIASAVTEENAQAMSEAGFIALSFGIESGNPEILKSVKKPSGVRHFYKCAEIFQKYPHIFTKGLLMCGFLQETIAQQLDTVRLGKDIKLDWYTIQPLNLIPGVKITQEALDLGIIDHKSLIDGTERPFVGSTGGQVRREKSEVQEARGFINLFEGDPNRVPTREEIQDIWFLMDYSVNYEQILNNENPIKLEMLHKLFISMCDKTHHTNALGNLFFAVIENKLGNISEALRRLSLAEEFSTTHDYWIRRFKVLGLDKMLKNFKSELSQIKSA